MNNQIQLGYACINMELRESDIFTSRSAILKTANTKGIDYVKQLALANVDDLLKILIFNEAHGIRFYRLSSCIFPHLDNPLLESGAYGLDWIKDKLKIVGAYAKKYGHRLTMHPGQYVQLASVNIDVVDRSIKDIENHALLLKYLGYTPADGACLIIHGGGTFGDKNASITRFKENWNKLSKLAQSYVVLENDEFSYGVIDILELCEYLKIPFCLDLFHNSVAKDRIELTDDLWKRIIATWKSVTPKIHYSQQQSGLRVGAHSKTVDELPEFIFGIASKFNINLDIMLEVKDKERSVFKMYYKYFDPIIDVNGRINYLLKPAYT